MAITIHTAVTMGLQVIPITIEAALGSGFSGLQILGLSQEYSRDARERIRAALEGLGLTLPARRLIVSARPSEILKNFKSGMEHLDLPCAIAVLAALAEQQNVPRVACAPIKKLSAALKSKPHYFAGQLSLSGDILPLKCSLAFEILALKKENPLEILCCNPARITSPQSLEHALRVSTTLKECIQILVQNDVHEATPICKKLDKTFPRNNSEQVQISLEQRAEKVMNTLSQFEHIPALALALCLSAAGRHHILLAGSPGCGKTYALRTLKNLLPPLTHEERVEVALVHTRDPHEITERPFRSPHHSASSAALLGGSLLQPGEVSLAHHGALFLDELAEFPRPSLEALREPLDERKISLSRARGRIELPAHFLLAAATNPCPCGYVFSRTHQCRCAVGSPLKYQQKLSGPLLERFSILLLLDDLFDSHQHSETTSPILQTTSKKFFRAYKSDPLIFSKHFVQVQDSLWTDNAQRSRFNLQNHALLELAHNKNWSTRTLHRISQLTETLSTFFTGILSEILDIHEFPTLAEELRQLERTLQAGVRLLTPLSTPFTLKKAADTHDTPLKDNR